MSATQVAALLFQLQQIDLELDRLTAEQQAVQNTLQENSRVKRLRAETTNAQRQCQSSQHALSEAEWTLEDVAQRLKAQEQRLYSGAVMNAKELQSLQQEAQRLRAQQNQQEDAILEMIDASESLQKKVERYQSELKQAEEEWRRESSVQLERREQIEKRRSELQVKRGRLASTVTSELLTRYDKMRRSKQGKAVAKVEQNSCQWCRVILTPSELQHVRMSRELQTCTNCGRILYYDR
jgi:uncharacterized protein